MCVKRFLEMGGKVGYMEEYVSNWVVQLQEFYDEEPIVDHLGDMHEYLHRIINELQDRYNC